MKKQHFQENLNRVLKHRNAALVFSSALIVANILLGLALLMQNEKVVVVPPKISKQFWVASNEVSDTYLEEMSLFLINQLLDVSMACASRQAEVVLGHVSPEFYGDLKKRLIKEAEYYQKKQVSTNFKAVSVEVDRKKLAVKVTGDLVSFVAGKRVSQKRGVYQFKFRHKNYELLITDFSLLEEQKS